MKKINLIVIVLFAFALTGYSADIIVDPINPTQVPKTGQTTSYAARDDGALQKGVTPPSPRFAIQANTNCVIDNVTGLMWARNANQWKVAWGVAITNCNTLNYGGYSDWRLPNPKEFMSLMDYSANSPMLPAGHPFYNSDWGEQWWWTSTTANWSTTEAISFRVMYGHASSAFKTTTYCVWPVRGP